MKVNLKFCPNRFRTQEISGNRDLLKIKKNRGGPIFLEQEGMIIYQLSLIGLTSEFSFPKVLFCDEDLSIFQQHNHGASIISLSQ